MRLVPQQAPADAPDLEGIVGATSPIERYGKEFLDSSYLTTVYPLVDSARETILLYGREIGICESFPGLVERLFWARMRGVRVEIRATSMLRYVATRLSELGFDVKIDPNIQPPSPHGIVFDHSTCVTIEKDNPSQLYPTRRTGTRQGRVLQGDAIASELEEAVVNHYRGAAPPRGSSPDWRQTAGGALLLSKISGNTEFSKESWDDSTVELYDERYLRSFVKAYEGGVLEERALVTLQEEPNALRHLAAAFEAIVNLVPQEPLGITVKEDITYDEVTPRGDTVVLVRHPELRDNRFRSTCIREILSSERVYQILEKRSAGQTDYSRFRRLGASYVIS